MEFFSNIIYFLITIGILVFVHELGHFLAAVLTGMRADVFAIGMGNRLFGWNKLTGFSFGPLPNDLELHGNTDYRISAFPIGGYVKISGMIDESLDVDQSESDPEPWEYRAKPVWKRMIVISAGVIMNILLAIVIFWMINYVQGEQLMQTTEVGMVMKDSPAQRAGVLPGDKILSINDKAITHWEAIQSEIYFENIGKDITITLDRAGSQKQIQVPREQIPDISESLFGLLPSNTEAIINSVVPNRPAEAAGLLANDVIIALDGTAVTNQEDVITIIKSHPNTPVDVKVRRENETKSFTVTPSEEGLIGIQISSRYTGPMVRVEYTLLESFPKGVQQTIGATLLFGHTIWQLIAGRAEFSKSVGGPVKIAQMATRSAEVGILNFLAFMALLSISLAVMNILPFPALDGGHLIVLIYEAVFRKPLPQIVQIRIQQVGMAILLGFMVFIIYNDIFG